MRSGDGRFHGNRIWGRLSRQIVTGPNAQTFTCWSKYETLGGDMPLLGKRHGTTWRPYLEGNLPMTSVDGFHFRL